MIDLDWTENWKLFNGDSLEVLKQLPDKAIDCCITSPPYYGLRDYGTGTWVGGDPDCDHVASYSATKKQGNPLFNENRPSRENTLMAGYYKPVCPKCGAVREDKQIGLEEAPEQYINRLVNVFHEVKRVLKDDGTLWINIGDSYNGSGRGRNADGTVNFSVKSSKQATNKGSTEGIIKKQVIDSCKPKDLIGIPWMLAFALRADGWYLRQDIIWHKPNPMPESVTDRCVKSHEYIFLLSKSKTYFFDHESIQEESICKDDSRNGMGKISYDGSRSEHPESMGQKSFVSISDKRNKRDVWTVNVGSGYADEDNAHYATYPKKLIEPCVLAGAKIGGVVLDPFNGTGTTGSVALQWQRKYIGIDLNKEYIAMATRRLQKESDQFCFFDILSA